jgi:hypothetical protein
MAASGSRRRGLTTSRPFTGIATHPGNTHTQPIMEAGLPGMAEASIKAGNGKPRRGVRTTAAPSVASAGVVGPDGVVRAPQPFRGRLLDAKQIAGEVFCGHVSPEWVRRNVPDKIPLGHSTVVWYEYDVLDYIHNLKEA